MMVLICCFMVFFNDFGVLKEKSDIGTILDRKRRYIFNENGK